MRVWWFGLPILGVLIFSSSALAMPRVGVDGAACAYDTIGDAIGAASSGDTIYISPGDYFEQPGLVDISLDFRVGTPDCAASNSVLIPVEPIVTITAFGGSGGLFAIDSTTAKPIDVTFTGIRFSNAISDEGGLISIGNASVQIAFSVLTLGTAERGGCVFVDGGALALNRSVLEDCAATMSGGGAYVRSGRLTVFRSDVLSNNAERGGAIYVSTSGEDTSELAISESEFSDNEAADAGGAIAVDGSTSGIESLEIADSLFTNNRAGSYGGALYSLSADSLDVLRSDFSANAVTSGTLIANGGGAIHLISTSPVQLADAKFTDNASTGQGGAVMARGLSTVQILDGRFENNEARSGGGIYANEGTLSAQDTVFQGNDALDGNGGGIARINGEMTLTRVIIEQNSAFSQGGGIAAFRVSGWIDNSRVIGNSANTGGGMAIIESLGLAIRSVATGDGACRGSDLSANAYCSEFRDNTATRGGAIAILRSNKSFAATSVLVEGTAMIGNGASSAGRHVYATDGGSNTRTQDNVVELRNLLVTRGQFVTAGIPYAAAIYVGERIDLRLNSVTAAALPGAAIRAEGPDTELRLTNTLLWDNADPSIASQSGTTVSRQCAYSEPEVLGSRNLGSNVDPVFFDDPDRGKYRLDPLASPLIGVCESGPVDDLDGVARGAGWEPGAFEVGSEPPQLISASPAANLLTGEDGSSDVVSVVLAKPPLGEVSIPVVSSRPDEAVPDSAVLLFDAEDWDQAQNIGVSGVDDDTNDGDQAFQVRIGPSVSDDPAYSGLDAIVVHGINKDDDESGPTDLIFSNGFQP